jgi:cell division protein FtsQ
MRLKKEKSPALLIKLLIIVLLFLGGVFLYMSPWGQVVRSYTKSAWDYVVDKADWHVDAEKNIWVVGHKRTDKEDVLKALNIQLNQKMNTIDLDEKRQALEKLPWIKKAVIERKLPNQLVITVWEKTPIARWQNQGKYYLLDEDGQPVQDKQYLSEDLILVVGSDAPKHILELLKALDKVPDISTRVRSAQRIENRRWNLRLMDAEKGLEILLPQTDIDQALIRLDKQNKKAKLLKKDIESIDIRLSDRIIVHPKRTTPKKKAKK